MYSHISTLFISTLFISTLFISTLFISTLFISTLTKKVAKLYALQPPLFIPFSLQSSTPCNLHYSFHFHLLFTTFKKILIFCQRVMSSQIRTLLFFISRRPVTRIFFILLSILVILFLCFTTQKYRFTTYVIIFKSSFSHSSRKFLI